MRRLRCLALVLICAWALSSCASSPGAPAAKEPVAGERESSPSAALPPSAPADKEEAAAPPSAPADKEEAAALPPSAPEEELRAAVPDLSEREGKALAKESKDFSAASPVAKRPEAPPSSGLKAGFADDNKQFNYFLDYLRQYGVEVEHLSLNIEERIVLKVQDRMGRSLPNAAVTVSAGAKILCQGSTYADGSFLFFPSQYEAGVSSYRAAVAYQQNTQEVLLDRQGKRNVEVVFGLSRAEQKRVPLDILFILDTTGSMGEEIERLKDTIEIINLNLSSLSSQPEVRLGMVLFRDRGDEYVTRVVPFTEDLKLFQMALGKVEADGGGDDPEDLQSALEASVQRLEWSRGGIHLGFIITDAPPHLDYGQSYDYTQAASEAKRRGIKLFSVGTGGLNLSGEYVLRQISQYTSAKYIFLTYGESGESEGGAPGSVSHHTGANYQTDKLEAIIIRLAKEELSYLTDQPLEAPEDYFQAVKLSDEEREETLKKLFESAFSQLLDYSSLRISPDGGEGIPASVLPIAADAAAAASSEYFTEQLILSLSRSQSFRRAFRLVERKDFQSILAELELQLSGLADEANASRVGSLLGAKVLILGKLYLKGDAYELFLKLLRVETGEVLSITKAVLDRRLGLQ